MADEIAAAARSLPVPRPMPLRPGPPPRRKPAKRKVVPTQDPDEYFKIARQLVIANYNAARNPEHAPEMAVEAVFIEHFTKTLQNWTVIATSPIARRLMWVIAGNHWKGEAYISVYQKLTNTSVKLEKQADS